MELREFVAQSLVQIVLGVLEANKEATKALRWDHGPFILQAAVNNAEAGRVDFDVAVTATTSGSAGGKGGLEVAGIGFGVRGETRDEQQHVSRIRFSVLHDQIIKEARSPSNEVTARMGG